MLRIHLKCPKKLHNHYNPAAHKQAGIKGNCVICAGMYDLWRKSKEIEAEIEREVHRHDSSARNRPPVG